jgi:hypothetical protein
MEQMFLVKWFSENSKKIPFGGKHMNPFGTLQVHCCSSFEIAEKATRSYLLIMFP